MPQTAEKTATAEVAVPEEATSKGEIAVFHKPRLPFHPAIEERFGVKAAEWKALVEAVYPMATSVDSVVLALSYCKARSLDPFKRVVHIVPIWDRNKDNGPNQRKGGYVDTIWPGIGELRTTAFRTKLYAGADACEFGPMIDGTFTSEDDSGNRRNIALKYPEWAQLTVYRLVGGVRVPVPGPRVYWQETYARIGRTTVPNDMWQKRPVGQLEKCAEAAALRRAFPEELGDELSSDEAEAVQYGPQHARDITPPRPERPAEDEVSMGGEAVAPTHGRTASADAASPTQSKKAAVEFHLTDLDGEVVAHGKAASAATAFENELALAAQRGSDALDGLWESNGLLLTELREHGRESTANSLAKTYAEHKQAIEQAAAEARKKAEAKAKPAEGEKAQVPNTPPAEPKPGADGVVAWTFQHPDYKKVPNRPKPFGDGNVVAFFPWLCDQLRDMPTDQIPDFLSEKNYGREFDYFAEKLPEDYAEIKKLLAAKGVKL